MSYLLWQPISSWPTLYSQKGLKVKIFAIEIILSSLLGGPDSPSRGYQQPFLLSYWNTWNNASAFYSIFKMKCFINQIFKNGS